MFSMDAEKVMSCLNCGRLEPIYELDGEGVYICIGCIIRFVNSKTVNDR